MYTNENGDEEFKGQWNFEITGDYAAGELNNTALSIWSDTATYSDKLTGDLTEFGIAGPGVLHFMFDGLAGIIDGESGLFGDTAGVIFTDAFLPVNFNFEADHSSVMMGNANTFKVPVTGTFSLSLLGLSLLVVNRQRFTRR